LNLLASSPGLHYKKIVGASEKPQQVHVSDDSVEEGSIEEDELTEDEGQRINRPYNKREASEKAMD
jgi:hypothetical protein